MTDPRPGTTMGRIAELERQVADLAARLEALEGEPRRRDPASTTGGSATIRSQPDPPKRHARQPLVRPQTGGEHLFGFGTVTAHGGTSD